MLNDVFSRQEISAEQIYNAFKQTYLDPQEPMALLDYELLGPSCMHVLGTGSRSNSAAGEEVVLKEGSQAFPALVSCEARVRAAGKDSNQRPARDVL